MRDRVRPSGAARNGLLFEAGQHMPLLLSLREAAALHADADAYAALRAAAAASATDVSHTARSWHAELLRLRACLRVAGGGGGSPFGRELPEAAEPVGRGAA
mmetsp:Transcript_2986/g.9840  ORF Transcript_2986/g.9840 Transcript_2986/m.9840 type:complete len:102 (-) Transcript_2986:61-366(-)